MGAAFKGALLTLDDFLELPLSEAAIGLLGSERG